jgi:hypothetical protein
MRLNPLRVREPNTEARRKYQAWLYLRFSADICGEQGFVLFLIWFIRVHSRLRLSPFAGSAHHL